MSISASVCIGGGMGVSACITSFIFMFVSIFAAFNSDVKIECGKCGPRCAMACVGEAVVI